MNKVTLKPEQVAGVLETLGLRLAGQAGSSSRGHTSFFIHQDQPGSSIPLALGKIVFHNGGYSHLKWYCLPSGDKLDEADRAYFTLNFYLRTGDLLGITAWDNLLFEARTRVAKLYSDRKAERLCLPKRSPSGKLIKRKAITRPALVCGISAVLEEWAAYYESML